MTFKAREIMSVCLKQPRASFSPQQRNMRHILTEFVDRPVLFVPAFAQIEWFTFFFWGLSVVIYFSSVCVCVCVCFAISCSSGCCGQGWVGWPRRSCAMNYSSFALAVSEGARLPAISAYIHHSRVCLGVCVCVCVCVCVGEYRLYC